MSKEETIQQELIKNFGFLEGKFRIPRERRIFLDVPADRFMDVFDYTVKKMNFNYLCIISGLDEGENLSFIYHLALNYSIILNIKISVPKSNPSIKTITGYFPSADLYERELEDLLGAKVEGLAKGRRYPLPDDWPIGQYPLRKDWKPQDEPEVKQEKSN
ncbi:MAG TPA: proton-conducting membrane transporter [Lentisphaeria bacterium]|nr:MAG: hypothetical protein A2X48_20170 [Lentisphaerae bacterium GWF2_49_21]HBC86215.1 proton-conducting membrane transporter [Lentisphaeria bacterium]